MFIISVLYFCTEMYWSTLEKLSSCSVVKRTFLDPCTGWPPSTCALDQPPRHEDLTWDKCRNLLSHTVGHQQEAGLSQAPHAVGQRGRCPLATPTVTPGYSPILFVKLVAAQFPVSVGPCPWSLVIVTVTLAHLK